MSKNELDKIEVRSRRVGTVGETMEEMQAKAGIYEIKEIEVKSKERGTIAGKVNYERRIIPFQKFEIVVELTSDGKFVGIEEVRINKDFRDPAKVIRQKAFEYIDSYKPE